MLRNSPTIAWFENWQEALAMRTVQSGFILHSPGGRPSVYNARFAAAASVMAISGQAYRVGTKAGGLGSDIAT
jgi:hypothetical protein